MSAVSLLTQARCKYCCMHRSQVLRKYEISHMYWQCRKKSTKTHYEILQVSRNASSSEIKEAFFKLSKQTHPDMGSGKHSQFVLVNEAYSVLKNADSKKAYDNKTFGLPKSSMGGRVDPEAFHKARQQFYKSRQEEDFKESFRQNSEFRDPGMRMSVSNGGFLHTLSAICSFIIFFKLFFFVVAGTQSRRRDMYSEMHGNAFEQPSERNPHRGKHNMVYRDDRLYYPNEAHQYNYARQGTAYRPRSDQDMPMERKRKKEKTETVQAPSSAEIHSKTRS